MSALLHHLVYQSVATYLFEEPELARLLAQSRAWNTAHGLTGMLLYSRGSIMQVLEGAEAEVRSIFARIARDKRHVNLVKLADGPIGERRFAHWSMGFLALNPADFDPPVGYLDPAQGRVPMTNAAVDHRLHAVLAHFLTEDIIRL